MFQKSTTKTAATAKATTNQEKIKEYYGATNQPAANSNSNT